MNNSPIANRTRARVNIVHLDASNQDRMSERDLMRTPNSNGPVAEQENGIIGDPERSPDDFVGFDPNDIDNVSANSLYNAFMDNTRNFGHLLHTHENQSSPNIGHNFGQLPHTQEAQSLPSANQGFGYVPYTHSDQFLPNTNHMHNFNTPVDNLGQTRQNRKKSILDSTESFGSY